MSNESNDAFWDDLVKTAYTGGYSTDFAGMHLAASEKEAAGVQRVDDAVERRITGRALEEGAFTSMRALTERGEGLPLPVKVGTRVQFSARAEASLTYSDPPAPNAAGVVVAVKSASGEITDHNGVVFVKWADGVLRPTHAEHLRPATGKARATAASAGRIRVASLGDLTDFLRVASDTLVHKATRDLWKVQKDGAEFVIERLFRDDGAPLKV